MSASESLKFILTADASSAVKGFKQAGDAAEKELGKAEGKLDKIGGQLTKGGAGAIAFAAVAGTALIGAAGSFEHLALKAGEMSDATGLTVDQASRWIEVSGDMGIGADTIESALGKMNKTLGATPEKFRTLGIEVAKTSTGVTDVNGTFLNTIDRLNQIKDPAERAAAAATIFGKGWQGAAELLKLSTDDIRTQLAAVSDQKVINDDELVKAKEYRKSLDTLKDSAEDLALSIGQSAAPVIGGFSVALSKGVSAFTKLDEATGGAIGGIAATGVAAIAAVGGVALLAGQLVSLSGKVKEMGPIASKAALGMGVLTVAVAAYSLQQKLNADNAASFAKGLNEVVRGTSGVKDSIPGLIKVMHEMKDVAPEETFAKMAKANLAAAVTIRDAAVASDDYRAKLEAVGVSVTEMNTAIDAEVKAQKTAIDATAGAQAKVDALATATDGAVVAYEDLAATTASSSQSLGIWSAVAINAERITRDAADAQEAYKKNQEDVNRATDEAKKAADDYVQGLKDIRDAQLDLVPHTEDLEQATRDVETAYHNLQTQEAENVKVQKNHKTSTDDKAQSTRDLETSEYNLVQQLLETAKVYADSRGNVEGSTASVKDQIDMLELAKAKYPELAGEIQKYIDKLNAVPPVLDTKVTVDTARAITDASTWRQHEEATPVRLTAHLDNIIIDGETHAAGQTTVSGISVVRGAPGGAPRQRATGGPVAAGGVYEVNEGNRPEVLTQGDKTYLLPGANGQVTPIGAAAGRAASAVAGGVTVNVYMTVMGMVATEREITRKLAEGLVDGMRRGEIIVPWAS